MTIAEALYALGVREDTLTTAEKDQLDRDGFLPLPGILTMEQVDGPVGPSTTPPPSYTAALARNRPALAVQKTFTTTPPISFPYGNSSSGPNTMYFTVFEGTTV